MISGKPGRSRYIPYGCSVNGITVIGEVFLTDLVAQAAADGRTVVAHRTDDPDEGRGVNTRVELAAVEQVEEQWYPLGDELLAHFGEIETLASEGSVRIEKHGSRWCWATRIFVAYRDASQPRSSF